MPVFENDTKGLRENDFWAGVSQTWKYGPSLRSWTSHEIHNWILLLAIRGKGTIKMNSGELTLAQYDVALLEPNLAHRYSAIADWELIWIHFVMPPSIMGALHWPQILPKVRVMSLPPTVFAKVKMELAEVRELHLARSRNWYVFVISLITSALLRIDNLVSGDGTLLPGWMVDAMLLLNDTECRMSIDEIASKFNLSRASFFAAFRRAAGCSPGQYRERKRLREAEQMLLQTDSTIAQIADAVGFDTPFYFSLRFKKSYGVSPALYRQKTRKNNDRNLR